MLSGLRGRCIRISHQLIQASSFAELTSATERATVCLSLVVGEASLFLELLGLRYFLLQPLNVAVSRSSCSSRHGPRRSILVAFRIQVLDILKYLLQAPHTRVSGTAGATNLKPRRALLIVLDILKYLLQTPHTRVSGTAGATNLKPRCALLIVTGQSLRYRLVSSTGSHSRGREPSSGQTSHSDAARPLICVKSHFVLQSPLPQELAVQKASQSAGQVPEALLPERQHLGALRQLPLLWPSLAVAIAVRRRRGLVVSREAGGAG